MGSSDRSSMCDEKSGSPFFSKYSSFAFMRPSNHGSHERWQWSVCRMTGTPYSSAIARVWRAPATVPAMQALSPSLGAVLPAMNWPPPRENWMIMGPPYLAAASRHEAIEHDETTFTAGMAYWFSLAWLSKSHSASPVTTPGLTEAGSGVTVLVCIFTPEREIFDALTEGPWKPAGAEKKDSMVRSVEPRPAAG